MDQLKQLVRPITSGSRQAPDPYDQYLECRGLYRKHTARDASSLFRVIAEQLYDTQSLHYEIRLECVRFMTLKRRIFEKHIPGDYDSYLFDMSKPKTYGTMTELRAMCCLYKRNAILYEPYNMGTAVIFNRNFQHDFRVFYNNENHFDSVYEVDDIQAAAICQSITFKLLYQMLFKLPDVNFAVESMLHPHTFAWDPFDVVFDQQGYMIRIKCSDGRIFTLDLPEVTNCILEDFQLCNFHSSRGIQSRNRNLRQLLDQSQNPDMAGNVGDEARERMLMCANKMVSCVRQLLDDGITPFPYKVAKSLDPNMYRNIEFDCWNDIRKEAKRHNAYCNDYNFKVGAKCRVELQHEVEMVTCHIQKISRDNSSCLVFLEKIGKMTLVPYDSLHPVPPDEFRPWTLPYRYQQRSLNRLPQMAQKFGNKSGHNNNKLTKWKKNKVVFEEANCFESTQYAPENHNNADQQQDGQNNIEQAQEPLEQPEDQEQASRAKEREEGAKLQPQQQQKQVVKGYKATRQKNNSGSHHNKDSMVAVAMPPPGHFMGFTPSMIARPGAQPSPAWPNSPMAMPEEFQYPLQGPPLPPPTDGCVYMPIGSFAPHPTMPGQLLPLPPIPTPTNMAPAAVGVEPRRSMQMNGEDLPSDVGTLRYFYNMGVDMHLRMNHQPSPEELAVVPYIQQQGTPEKVEDHLAVEATPPATPEAGNGGTTEPLALEKSNSKRNGSPQTGKYRGKRPEQLHELKDPMGHAALLPTPTPSPGTNGNQFSFITPPPPPPPPQHLMTPPRLLQPPPIYYHKAGSGAPPQIPGVPGSPSQIPVLPAGQNPYAWGLPPPPPPSMVPHFEVINNFPIDAQQQQQQQVAQVSAQQAGPQLPALPAQSQPAANYGGAAPRHH